MMQKNDIKIFLASREHIPAIAELEKMCFSSPWSEKAILETMSGESSLFLVATLKEKICGYIGSYSAMDEGYITNVAVNPDFRRQGVGKALVGELIKQGKERRLSFLTLEVRESNEGAIALYSNLGFENVGKRPRFYSNPTEAAYLMTYYMGKEREN